MKRFPHVFVATLAALWVGLLALGASAQAPATLQAILNPPCSAITQGSALMLCGEVQGLALDFTGNNGLGSVTVKDTTTAANGLVNRPVDNLLVQSGTSPKLVAWSDGLYRWTNHNLFINSDTPATQNVTVLITGATYTYGVVGSGSLAGTVGASGTASAGSPVTFVATGTSGTFTKTGTLTSMWINRGTVQTTPYHATGAAAWYAVPIEYDGVSQYYALVEPQATNLDLQSQAFDNASWTKWQTTVSADAIAAPDGTTTGDKLAENGVNDSHFASQNITVSSGATVAYSVFAKAAGRSTFYLTINNGAGNYVAVLFNLGTGAVGATSVGGTSGTLTGSSITSVGNGWYRCTVVGSINNTLYSLLAGLSNTASPSWSTAGQVTYTGDSASGVDLWQAQVETGSVVTSPIPTFAATVTRGVDNVQAAKTLFPWGPANYSFLVDYNAAVGNASSATLLASGPLTLGNFIGMTPANSGSEFGWFASGAAVSGSVLGTRQKFDLAVNSSGSGRGSIAGGAIGSTSASDFTGASSTAIAIGNITTGARPVNARIYSVVILPRFYSDAELRAKST